MASSLTPLPHWWRNLMAMTAKELPAWLSSRRFDFAAADWWRRWWRVCWLKNGGHSFEPPIYPPNSRNKELLQGRAGSTGTRTKASVAYVRLGFASRLQNVAIDQL